MELLVCKLLATPKNGHACCNCRRFTIKCDESVVRRSRFALLLELFCFIINVFVRALLRIYRQSKMLRNDTSGIFQQNVSLKCHIAFGIVMSKMLHDNKVFVHNSAMPIPD